MYKYADWHTFFCNESTAFLRIPLRAHTNSNNLRSHVGEIKAEAQETWRKLWTHSDKAGHLRRILSREGTEAGPKLYNNIADRRSVLTLVQLRTGYCALNKYLHRIGKKDSPKCTCTHGIESVEHYLLDCPKYQVQRAELREAVNPGDITVAKLLENCKTFNHTMEYIRATGRMEDRET